MAKSRSFPGGGMVGGSGRGIQAPHQFMDDPRTQRPGWSSLRFGAPSHDRYPMQFNTGYFGAPQLYSWQQSAPANGLSHGNPLPYMPQFSSHSFQANVQQNFRAYSFPLGYSSATPPVTFTKNVQHLGGHGIDQVHLGASEISYRTPQIAIHPMGGVDQSMATYARPNAQGKPIAEGTARAENYLIRPEDIIMVSRGEYHRLKESDARFRKMIRQRNGDTRSRRNIGNKDGSEYSHSPAPVRASDRRVAGHFKQIDTLQGIATPSTPTSQPKLHTRRVSFPPAVSSPVTQFTGQHKPSFKSIAEDRSESFSTASEKPLSLDEKLKRWKELINQTPTACHFETSSDSIPESALMESNESNASRSTSEWPIGKSAAERLEAGYEAETEGQSGEVSTVKFPSRPAPDDQQEKRITPTALRSASGCVQDAFSKSPIPEKQLRNIDDNNHQAPAPGGRKKNKRKGRKVIAEAPGHLFQFNPQASEYSASENRQTPNNENSPYTRQDVRSDGPAAFQQYHPTRPNQSVYHPAPYPTPHGHPVSYDQPQGLYGVYGTPKIYGYQGEQGYIRQPRHYRSSSQTTVIRAGPDEPYAWQIDASSLRTASQGLTRSNSLSHRNGNGSPLPVSFGSFGGSPPAGPQSDTEPDLRSPAKINGLPRLGSMTNLNEHAQNTTHPTNFTPPAPTEEKLNWADDMSEEENIKLSENFSAADSGKQHETHCKSDEAKSLVSSSEDMDGIVVGYVLLPQTKSNSPAPTFDEKDVWWFYDSPNNEQAISEANIRKEVTEARIDAELAAAGVHEIKNALKGITKLGPVNEAPVEEEQSSAIDKVSETEEALAEVPGPPPSPAVTVIRPIVHSDSNSSDPHIQQRTSAIQRSASAPPLETGQNNSEAARPSGESDVASRVAVGRVLPVVPIAPLGWQVVASRQKSKGGAPQSNVEFSQPPPAKPTSSWAAIVSKSQKTVQEKTTDDLKSVQEAVPAEKPSKSLAHDGKPHWEGRSVHARPRDEYRKLYLNNIPKTLTYDKFLPLINGGLIDDVYISGLSPEFARLRPGERPVTEKAWFGYITFYNAEGARNFIKYLNYLDAAQSPIPGSTGSGLVVAYMTMEGVRIPVFVRDNDQRRISPEVIDIVERHKATRVLKFTFKKNIGRSVNKPLTYGSETKARSNEGLSTWDWDTWQKEFSTSDGQGALYRILKQIQVWQGTPYVYIEKITLLPLSKPQEPVHTIKSKIPKTFLGPPKQEVFRVEVHFLRISSAEKVKSHLESHRDYRNHCLITYEVDPCAQVIDFPETTLTSLNLKEIENTGTVKFKRKKGKKAAAPNLPTFAPPPDADDDFPALVVAPTTPKLQSVWSLKPGSRVISEQVQGVQKAVPQKDGVETPSPTPPKLEVKKRARGKDTSNTAIYVKTQSNDADIKELSSFAICTDASPDKVSPGALEPLPAASETTFKYDAGLDWSED